MPQIAMRTMDTHWTTDANACRCLLASDRTSASLSTKRSSSCRAIWSATQVTNRTANMTTITSMITRRPRVMIHTPISPCQNCAVLVARYVFLVVIFSVTPPDSRFQESVDVSVENGRRVAHFVLGTQVLDHLIRGQHVGPHLVTPAAAAITL